VIDAGRAIDGWFNGRRLLVCWISSQGFDRAQGAYMRAKAGRERAAAEAEAEQRRHAAQQAAMRAAKASGPVRR